MTIAYSRRALAQLASVYEYLLQRNPRAAADVSASIKLTIARLAHLPRLGKLTDEADVRILLEPLLPRPPDRPRPSGDPKHPPRLATLSARIATRMGGSRFGGFR
ncbi:MAG: type II toxin-antitoxin system RelE/ParE family toxin [Hyphomicrobiaceae bacterium]